MIIGGVVVLAVWLGFLVQGAPYVKSDDESAAQMIALVKGFRPKRVVDLGSGNGKLVILLARQGFKVDGVELNPWLVWRSRRRIKRLGLQDKAAVKWGNFWRYDTSHYDTVTLYGIQHIMPRLERKLRAELPRGAHVVSNYFAFPNLEPVKQIDRARAYEF
jgi:protein-L-isoaspartate O-methyltransferase